MNPLWGYELQRRVLFLFSVMLYHKAGNFLPLLLTKNPSSRRGFRDKSNDRGPTEEASAHGTCCRKCLHGREADLPCSGSLLKNFSPVIWLNFRTILFVILLSITCSNVYLFYFYQVRCLNLKTTMGKPFRIYGEIGRLPLEMRWQ